MMHKGQGIPVASHRDNYFIRVVQSSDSLWKQKKGNCFLEETKKKGNSFYLQLSRSKISSCPQVNGYENYKTEKPFIPFGCAQNNNLVTGETNISTIYYFTVSASSSVCVCIRCQLAKQSHGAHNDTAPIEKAANDGLNLE